MSCVKVVLTRCSPGSSDEFDTDFTDQEPEEEQKSDNEEPMEEVGL